MTGLYPTWERFGIFYADVFALHLIGEIMTIGIMGVFYTPQVSQSVASLVISATTLFSSGFIRFVSSINVRKWWRGKKDKTRQRHRQHWAHNTQTNQTLRRHIKLKIWAQPTPTNTTGGEHNSLRRVNSSYFFHKTPDRFLIVKSGNCIVGERWKKKSTKKGKDVWNNCLSWIT